MLTALFVCALVLGGVASYRWGGTAERETMCLLVCIWLATHASTLALSPFTPVLIYFSIDVGALYWLWRHQRRNWQWIPAALFTAMLLTHFIYFSGTSAGLLSATHRPYMDVLTALAYLQIASVGWASWERRNVRSGHGGVVGSWAVAADWLPRRYFGDARNV